MQTIDLMTTRDVAKLALLTEQALRRRSKRGLPPYPAARIAGQLRFERAHVEAWLRGEIADGRTYNTAAATEAAKARREASRDASPDVAAEQPKPTADVVELDAHREDA